MRHPRARLAACVLALTLSATPFPLVAQVRLRIQPSPVLVLEPTVQGADDIRFAAVVGATRLSDGTIVVADPLTPQLSYFDSSGKLRHSAIRRGSGPGELLRISWIGRCAADSVFVYDQRRVVVYDAKANFVRQFEPEGHPAQLQCAGGIIAGLAAHAPPVPTKSGTVLRVAGELAVFDRTGVKRRVLGTEPVAEIASTGAGWMPLPLGKATAFCVAAGTVYVGTADSGVVHRFGRIGSVEAGPSLGPIKGTPAAPTDVANAIESLLTLAPAGGLREAMKQRLAGLPIPTQRPLYAGLFADGAGLLWTQLTAPGSAPTRLRWAEVAGHSHGDVELAASLTVLEVGANYLLASDRDESGEQRIAVYKIERTR